MLGKTRSFIFCTLLGKLAEQQRSNKMLEEGMALMDKALRLAMTPDQLHTQLSEKMLENNWQIIRNEGLAQLDQKTGSFSSEEENLRETGDWKQFTVYQRGCKNENHCRKVPRTCALLDQIPEANGCRRGQIKYSVIHPGGHVWPHTVPTNCKIRAHLGLKVPKGPRIRVGNETK
ncbi:aspartyl/asparaginyl beta-hydroxylase-like [Dreissena polymorpha]|uniref:aspartyl/asparaginyl beta-hydroxylase-like n=1 Tax=Dreissena polymorpha TaxID=45954 RepID=UPI002263E4E8|nr:aspartyl/asparaginyl beta-hydroxylase-like [Dreissena polymorpha]